MRLDSRGITLTAMLLAGSTVPAAAQVLIGTPTDGNCFPFTCTADGPSTYYQQVYASSSFPTAGFITGIDFFLEPGFNGQLNSISFTISLSTTTLGLNVDGPGGIQSGDPDGNVGADQTLFGTYTLGGPAPATLSFAGNPFYYDPAAGNLLFDLRVTGGTFAAYGAYYNANSGNSTDYSRIEDFDADPTPYESGWGLQTRFDYGNVVPEPATMSLLATGLVGLVGIGRRRRKTT